MPIPKRRRTGNWLSQGPESERLGAYWNLEHGKWILYWKMKIGRAEAGVTKPREYDLAIFANGWLQGVTGMWRLIDE
jgi:hypothetical protein